MTDDQYFQLQQRKALERRISRPTHIERFAPNLEITKRIIGDFREIGRNDAFYFKHCQGRD